MCLKRMYRRHYVALVSRAGSWLNPHQTTHSQALGDSCAAAGSSVSPNLRDTTPGGGRERGRGAGGAARAGRGAPASWQLSRPKVKGSHTKRTDADVGSWGS